MTKLFDKYDLQARIYPAILVLLPIGIFFFAWMLKIQEVPKLHDWLKLGSGSLIGACMLLFLAQMARSHGKTAEAELVKQWDGLPTTIMLRHRDTSLDPVTKKRYHEALAHLVPGITIPTELAEQADPDRADSIYSGCVSYLRSQTRDQHKFPLLITENIDYGFRRNLFGLKGFGIVCSLTGLGGCVWRLIRELQKGAATLPLTLLCVLICGGLLYLWIFKINAAWVRQAADAYARRLLETVDQLQKVPSEKKQKSKAE